MRKIGYVRVSSVDQNPKRQLQQMNEIGIDIIYEEKVSGATQDRPELQNMLNELREGDTIYVTDLIRMRQQEGIDLTKKEGKYQGRVKKYHEKHAGMNYARKLYEEGNMTVKQICEITNVSRSSLYRKLQDKI